MERFLSNAVNRIDAKGRVSVPAHFRSVLQLKGLSDLYVLQSFDMPAIDCGGMDLLEAFEARMGVLDPFAMQSTDMSIHFHGEASFLKVDSAGRITVTDFIREHTGITDEVHFVAALPKTRSAKIVRRLIKMKYLGEELGDLASVENPQALDEIPVRGE